MPRRSVPENVRLSKFLSLVLRHRPERIGLRLDEAGWADVEVLLRQANRAGVPLSRETLRRVVAENDKQRFAFSSDGRKIRANQGHSIPVDLQLAPTSPPAVLYHGTARRFLDAIRRDGLMPRRRTHVHLSGDAETALAVGRRHGSPVVLTIKAQEMERDGYVFFRAANGVWLTKAVPPAYIGFPEEADDP